MASVIGLAITNLTSKVGILSRKACMRYAEETGIKLVDKSRQIGRSLNKEEVEQVFAEVLPKKCRPSIIDNIDEASDCLVHSGFSKEKAVEALSDDNLGAATIMDGLKKRPIYMPFEKWRDSVGNQSGIAHEVEHALEYNNRVKKIWERIKNGLKIKFFTKFDKNYPDKALEKELPIAEMQVKLQFQHNTLNFMQESSMTNVLNIPSNVEGLAKFNGYESEKRFMVKLREYIRNNFVSSKFYRSRSLWNLKAFIKTVDTEIPAYTVQGNVERYALKLGENQTPKAIATTFLYDDARKIMRRERWLYIKNRLKGKISPSQVYTGDKSLLKLAKNSKDKQAIKELTKNMDDNTKEELFYQLLYYPKSLNGYKALIDATKVNGNSEWIKYPGAILDMNPNAVKNQDFLRIISIQNENYMQPEYIGCIAELSKLTPEQLKAFASLSGIKGADGATLKYKYLFRNIEHPQFDKLKAITDIEVNGKNPYAECINMIGELDGETLNQVHKIVTQQAKEGKESYEELIRAIYLKNIDEYLSLYKI